MPTITGTGQGQEADDIAVGTAVVVEPSAVARACFFRTSAEEIVSFSVPSTAPTEEPPPDEEGGAPPTEPAPPGTTQPLLSEYTVREDAGTLTVLFTRGNPRAAQGIQFAVVTQPGTAVQGTHYQNLASPIVFLPDETSVERTLTILDANMGPGVSKSFTMRISPTPSRFLYARGPISVVTVTINGV